eukprot:gene7560-8398_t
MAANVYWRSDEPDGFQVKNINVPGVFPRPSSKINSKSVFVESKPWLQTQSMDNDRKKAARNEVARPAAARGERPNSSSINNSLLQKKNAERTAKQDIGNANSVNAAIEPKKSLSASLKDLRNEDKKRITNLIKELAKSGEERKIAVGSLHKERLLFEERQKELKAEQEKLILERDELKEKLLEYKFLIDQFNKQLKYEKESHQAETVMNSKIQSNKYTTWKDGESRPETKLGKPSSSPNITATIQGEVEVDAQLDGRSSQKSHNDMQTYYHLETIDASGKSTVSRQTDELRKENSKPQPSTVCSNQSCDKEMYDSSRVTSHQVDNNVKHKMEEEAHGAMATVRLPEEITSFLKEETQSISSSLHKALFEQQDKLIEQQKEMQHQIERLQLMQANSNIELLKALIPSEVADKHSISRSNDIHHETSLLESKSSDISQQSQDKRMCLSEQQSVGQERFPESSQHNTSHHETTNSEKSSQIFKRDCDNTGRLATGVVQNASRERSIASIHDKNENIAVEYRSKDTHTMHSSAPARALIYSQAPDKHHHNRTVGTSELENAQSDSFAQKMLNKSTLRESNRSKKTTSLLTNFTLSDQKLSSPFLKSERARQRNGYLDRKPALKKPAASSLYSACSPKRSYMSSFENENVWDGVEVRQSSLLDVLEAVESDSTADMKNLYMPYQSSGRTSAKFDEDECYDLGISSEHDMEVENTSESDSDSQANEQESDILSEVFYLKSFR